MKYIKRLITLPFFLALNVLGMIFNLFKMVKYWILFGGEVITYMHKDENKMIADIYTDIVNKKYYNKSK